MFYIILVVAMAASIAVYLLLEGGGLDFEVTKYVAGATLLVPAAIAAGLFLPRANRPWVWGSLAVAAVLLVTMD